METESKNYLEKIAQSVKSSVSLKLLSIFILVMLLMIPMAYVRSLIEERQSLQQLAIDEVSQKWANKQFVYGPVLTIPVQRKITEDKEIKIIREEVHILPATLSIDGEVSPQRLHRGIYEVVVYDSQLNISGKFDNLESYFKDYEEYEIFPEAAFLSIHISDLRGIRKKVRLKWNDSIKEVKAGSDIPSIIPSGITVNNIIDDFQQSQHSFSLDLQLQGSQHLGFAPLGKDTEVKLSSPWEDPSFSGSFLPDDRTVNESGFAARWNILELNRNYPQFWIGNGNGGEMQKSSFGVDLLLPSSNYQKAMRSAKYSLLAIALTFLTFFLVEIFNKRKVHPFQYILIGLALVLFYSLLVSISEHAGFNVAYAVSSITIISIISLYAKAILRDVKQTIVLFIILCFTYIFVYVTLQIQDYALLIGSIGLTTILAFAMYITRKLDWYDVSEVKSKVVTKG